MRFEYAPAVSYEDLGSGQVLYSAPGFPAFPARVSIELFERARQIVGRQQVSVWDPMCGAGGIVATLGIACAHSITNVIATDISGDAVWLARRNLELTSPQGLSRRANELRQMGANPSRIASAERLMKLVDGRAIAFEAAVADITDKASLPGIDPSMIDIVVTDLPYGSQTHWQTASERPLVSMLDVLWHVLPRHAVVVVAATDRSAFDAGPPAYRAFKHGHRTIKMYRAP
ncbi:hypothetical protein GCM10010862_12880 [Devosia nitrariae]|uniref:Uncharacterized protein n=1 Tax=Devosia nitrariae TaxID=2071872 RepID=A0ABQ5W2J4_9HYPH|nr:hypothetical protein GCM10010862_12880 [Devosia nitrariae]